MFIFAFLTIISVIRTCSEFSDSISMKRTLLFTLLFLHLTYSSPEASHLNIKNIALPSSTEPLLIGQSLVVKKIPKVERLDELKKANLSHYTTNLYNQIHLGEAQLSKKAFERAMLGYYNLQGTLKDKHTITIVDFDQSSTKKRLYVIDIKQKKLLYHSLVAHGKNTGFDMANDFGNTHRSLKSSLGFYVTAETYMGKFGYALRLDGKEKGFNSNARSRGIVMHGANYVNEAFAKQNNRLGRSYGCPSLPYSLHKKVIDQIKGGSLLYIHRSNAKYEAGSKLLNASQANKVYASKLKPSIV